MESSRGVKVLRMETLGVRLLACYERGPRVCASLSLSLFLFPSLPSSPSLPLMRESAVEIQGLQFEECPNQNLTIQNIHARLELSILKLREIPFLCLLPHPVYSVLLRQPELTLIA